MTKKKKPLARNDEKKRQLTGITMRDDGLLEK